MKIEVLYFKDCPNYMPTLDRVRAILAQEDISDVVLEIEIKDESTARSVGFPGSPTVRINGEDIEPTMRGSAQIGFACRRYPGGLPSEQLIRTAICEARDQ